MTRLPASRAWSSQEVDRAENITRAIASAATGSLLGAYQVGMWAGVATPKTGRDTVIRRVQEVMPLVQEFAAEQYPGKRLLIVSDGPGAWVYQFVDDTDDRLTVSANRRRKAATTKLRRALDEYAVGTIAGAEAVNYLEPIVSLLLNPYLDRLGEEAVQRVKQTETTE